MTNQELMVTIIVIVGATVLTRFLPFILFPPGRRIPSYLQRLQTVLPSAAIGLLVIYSLKELNLLEGNRGLPELLAVAGTVICHRLYKKTLLSIAGGTALYMFLIQIVFH